MICFFAVSVGPVRATTYQVGSWQVEVTLRADKPEILLGEPTSLSYTVRNLSREDLEILVGGDYQNDLGRPASFQVRARRISIQVSHRPRVRRTFEPRPPGR